MERSELAEIRSIRHEISARLDHDVGKLVAHYQALEQEMRQSRKYKFADPPPETHKLAETEKTEAAG